MSDRGFLIVYLCGALLAYAIRVPFLRRANRGRIREDRLNVREAAFNIISFVGLFVFPVNAFDGALPGLAYTLPVWAGWVGTAFLLGAIVLLWRAHVDLGRNWSAILQIKQEHSLVTDGIYRHIRHPMYAAHLLWAIAQGLLLENWLAGWAFLVVFVPLYLIRVPKEEHMMLEQFDEQYRQYISRTGKIIPRFWK